MPAQQPMQPQRWKGWPSGLERSAHLEAWQQRWPRASRLGFRRRACRPRCREAGAAQAATTMTIQCRAVMKTKDRAPCCDALSSCGTASALTRTSRLALWHRPLSWRESCGAVTCSSGRTSLPAWNEGCPSGSARPTASERPSRREARWSRPDRSPTSPPRVLHLRRR